jgi:hypothetical protein
MIHIFEKPSMRAWGVDSEVHIMLPWGVENGFGGMYCVLVLC